MHYRVQKWIHGCELIRFDYHFHAAGSRTCGESHRRGASVTIKSYFSGLRRRIGGSSEVRDDSPSGGTGPSKELRLCS